jgi:hypothetical protein
MIVRRVPSLILGAALAPLVALAARQQDWLPQKNRALTLRKGEFESLRAPLLGPQSQEGDRHVIAWVRWNYLCVNAKDDAQPALRGTEDYNRWSERRVSYTLAGVGEDADAGSADMRRIASPSRPVPPAFASKRNSP